MNTKKGLSTAEQGAVDQFAAKGQVSLADALKVEFLKEPYVTDQNMYQAIQRARRSIGMDPTVLTRSVQRSAKEPFNS